MGGIGQVDWNEPAGQQGEIMVNLDVWGLILRASWCKLVQETPYVGLIGDRGIAVWELGAFVSDFFDKR